MLKRLLRRASLWAGFAALCASWADALGIQRRPAAEAVPALPQEAVEAIAPEDLKAHVSFLADDLMLGRGPGTWGGDIAARYLATRLDSYGLKPGYRGSFFQSVELVGIKTTPSLVVGAQRRTLALEPGVDFVVWPERAESLTIADGELVFAGYGIEAPEWQWDDYKATPLAGKIVLVVANDPGLQDSSIFKGRRFTRYGWWRYKLDQAARLGALGVLLIHSPQTVKDSWDVIRALGGGEQYRREGEQPNTLRFAGWFTADAARRVVEATGRDYDLMVRRAQGRDFRPLEVGAHLAVDLRSTIRRVRSPNVVAVLEGRDPEARNEAVVLMAHYDGQGVGPPVQGDSIYNGAVDNAAGAAALLGTARALTRAPVAPRRSIVFLFTTAGEFGFKGAEAYLAAPIFPLPLTVAAVSVDWGNLWGPSRDVVALGAELSSLKELLLAVGNAEGLSLAEDPEPDAGHFFQSDQVLLAQAGIPAVLLRPGLNYADREPGWGREQLRSYREQRHHRPQDELRPENDYRGLAQQARLGARLAWALAQSASYPEWLPSSEFRSAGQRLKQMRQ